MIYVRQDSELTTSKARWEESYTIHMESGESHMWSSQAGFLITKDLGDRDGGTIWAGRSGLITYVYSLSFLLLQS